MHAHQNKLGDVVDLSASFLSQEEPCKEDSNNTEESQEIDVHPGSEVDLPMSQDQLVIAQQSNPSFRQCFESVNSQFDFKQCQSKYFVKDGVLMRKWSPPSTDDRSL